MRKIIFLGLITCLSFNALYGQAKTANLLRHVVLFQFKANASAANIKSVEDAFLLLPSKIKQIKAFEWGINSSPENLNEGLTHCFFASFSSEKDRDDYLVHPAHKAFVELLKPFLEKAVVVDYLVRN